jgi:flagellar hook-length control protein FliK
VPTVPATGGETLDGHGHAGGGQAGAWADSQGAGAFGEGGLLDSATVFADPAALPAEEQVADQVAYWIHQKTQNAELTLHRDGQPVEVSVSLSGNEAHVSFRSDQAHTRELLDGSMAQLSELLNGEGLVLSGMSVGTSASHGRGTAEQQHQRDGARRTQVLSSDPAAAAPLLRRGSAPERVLDIFV